MKRILLVGGGGALQTRLRALAPGVATAVICRASILYRVPRPQENDAVLALSDDAPAASWIAGARYIDAQWPVDAVATLAEIDQDKAVGIAEALGLPFHSAETMEAVHDKTAMRKMLRDKGLDDLPNARLNGLSDLERFYERHGPPLLLKPGRGRGSAGVAIVRDRDDLEGAYATAARAEAPRLEPSPPVVERFVEGPEFSVEMVSHDGVHYAFAVTEKFTDPRTRLELGHVVPARIAEDDRDRMLARVRASLTGLGVASGITHTEVILGGPERTPVLIETHLRHAGDDIPELVHGATGVDMVELFLRQTAGEDLASVPELIERAGAPLYSAAQAIWFVTGDRRGTLERIEGLREAAESASVVAVDQLIDDGAPCPEPVHSFARLASVRVHAADADTAIDAARANAALLKPVIAPEADGPEGRTRPAHS